MKILIINGPNLNLLGKREPGIYGGTDFETYLADLRAAHPAVTIDYFQSNIEGEMIDAIQRADGAGATREGAYDGILLNAGGYTHTSVAIADAVGAIKTPVVEVHISCILAREDFRHISLLAPVCRGSVMGFGLDSYRLGLLSFLK
uniref:3-dehydroquinate dehydratase n=1 Tax=termite gut metagenome TaxID=433724 RepID=S0DG46_9ZZZZ